MNEINKNQDPMKVDSYLFFLITWFIFYSILISCKPKTVVAEQFTLLQHDKTGLDFRNMLKETENFNIFKYQYFYNGGGVAIADFNNDGLQDICFTGNMVKNRLFLNKGDLSFEDITDQSGISKAEGWCTGVNAVDINNDGWMDLYICRAGYPFENLRSNLLYINNKDLTFTEKAAEYGLNDTAYSTHSGFFDYDRDGDLDLFLINHSTPEYSKGNLQIFTLHDKEEIEFGNKLFRNDDGTYHDVTASSGIKNNVLTFSLGLSISDINNDGWQDIFIGNDFNESDYLYINNQDGTFTDSAGIYFDHTSMFSMGSDVADINNDHWMDIVSLDMLPESNYLQKLHTGADNYDKVKSMIDKGFDPQYSKNTLQVSNGDHSFTEKAQMMGVSNTDWSWSSLFIDFDHDTYQDLFISNGYLRDHTDMDFLQFTMDLVVKIDRGEEEGNFEDYVNSMPPILQPNYFFINQKGERFVNENANWNLTTPSVSQGAAYGDLDNDGDIDIVVNNSNDYTWLYRNNENQQNNFITIKLSGPEKNIDGLGSKVILYAGGKSFSKELQTCRGFQSSVENKLFFGLGQIQKVDSVRVIWPDGKEQIQLSTQLNQLNEIRYSLPVHASALPTAKPKLIPTDFIKYDRIPSAFNDFKSQLLLPYFLTDIGPKAITGDLNGDQKDDLIILGNTENPTILYTQTNSGDFIQSTLLPPGKEISDGLCLDMDGDTDLDLIITVGSYRYKKDDPVTGLYFYSNDRNGKFTLKEFLHSPELNPSSIALLRNKSFPDPVFIIGNSSYQGMYPITGPLFTANKQGSGKYELRNTNINTGQVNDILIADMDLDDTMDIIIAAEWMPLKVFHLNSEFQMSDVTTAYFYSNESGFWKTILLEDLDKDGSPELLAGNLGTNNQFSASVEHPLTLYYDDYDRNGSPDPIIAYFLIDDTYPFPPREDLIRQVPMMNKRFSSFGLYAKANVKTILADSYEKARFLEVHTMENSFFKMENGKFKRYPLPMDFQVAPIFTFMSADIDADEINEILTAGNMTKTKVKLGRLNGNHGMMLRKKGGQLEPVEYSSAGVCVREDIRQIIKLNVSGNVVIGYLSTEGESHFFKLNPSK